MSVPGVTPRTILGSSSAAAVSDRLGWIAGRVWKVLSQQAIAFGALRIAVVCAVAWGVFAHERAMLGDEGERDAAALVQNAQRVASRSLADLDNALLRLAGRAERDGAAVDWRSLAEQGSVVIGERGALAVFDASGAFELGAIDALSKAERRTLVDDAGGDRAGRSIFASAGRVVLARRLIGRDGAVLGVLAAVVDPASLIGDIAERDASRGGVALVERTGRVLAGAGTLGGAVGASLPLGEPLRGADATEPAALGGGRPGYVAAIADSPLAVVATPPDLDRDPRLVRWGALCVVVAAILALLIAATAYALALRAALFEARISKQARRDPLTGLANRTAIRERLDQVFACPVGESAIALLVIDLDRFKYINDTHGHPIGDDLLRVVAIRLRALAGPGDLVGRLGGDEFAIVQRVAGYGDEAGVLALRVSRELAAPYELGSIHASVGASVGVAFAARDATATSELLKAADMALYAAKGQGRGSVRFFHPDMHHAVQRKVMIEGGLRNAIKRDELYLAYQSIKDARSEKTVGYEALLRWRFGETMVPPSEFIAVAEETGLIVPNRRLGVGARLRRHGAHAGRRPGGGQLFAGAARVVRLRFTCPQVPRPFRPVERSAGGRGHRVVPHQQQPAHRRAVASTQGNGGAHLARRFRHRLFEPQLSRTISVRQHQDRSLLRAKAGATRGDAGDRASDHRARFEFRHDDDRRGRRNPRPARDGVGTRLLRSAGVPVRRAETAGRGSGAGRARTSAPARRRIGASPLADGPQPIGIRY